MIDFLKVTNKAGLDVALKCQSSLWGETFDNLSYRSIRYLESLIDYNLAYERGIGGEWQDFSTILLLNQKPVGLWPLSVSKRDNVVLLTSQGAPLLEPTFVKNCPVLTQKRLSTACFQVAEQIASDLALDNWSSEPSFDGRADLGFWHLKMISEGAKNSVQHQLVIDLGLSWEEIRSRFRKSYKSLIRTGERMWEIEIVRSENNEKPFGEFRDLHRRVSGRITRSEKSWEMQRAMISQDKAFLITLRETNGSLVGGGYFTVTQDEGLYSVGAYDRSLFDRPLGHVVQASAVKELQRRGCKWYQIGRRFFSNDHPSPSPKELSISHFKQGFATHVFPKFLLEKSI